MRSPLRVLLMTLVYAAGVWVTAESAYRATHTGPPSGMRAAGGYNASGRNR
jgi:hypothetical protein